MGALSQFGVKGEFRSKNFKDVRPIEHMWILLASKLSSQLVSYNASLFYGIIDNKSSSEIWSLRFLLLEFFIIGKCLANADCDQNTNIILKRELALPEFRLLFLS